MNVYLQSLDLTSMLFGGFLVVILYILIWIGNFFLEKTFYWLEKRKELEERDKS